MNEKQATANEIEGILNYVPHSTEPRAYKDGYDIEAMISGYEKEGRDILKAGGYPLTVREILHSRFDKDYMPLGKPPLPRRIRDVMDMLTYFSNVRAQIKEKNTSWALCFMAYGVQAAMKARIRPIEPLIPEGVKRVNQLHAPKEKRNKYVLAYCGELMKKRISTSAPHLFSRFPNSKEKAIEIDGVRIFREFDLKAGEDKIITFMPDGQKKALGLRGFTRDYWKDFKEKKKRNDNS